MKFTMLFLLALGLLAGCSRARLEDRGQAIFFAETFKGNGRVCATCHTPAENFAISPEAIAKLPPTNPLFVNVPGLEDPAKLREDALIIVTGVDRAKLRQTPKLTHLRTLCDKHGNCATLGLLGDRTKSLCTFSNEAIANHLTKKVPGVSGKDFRLMSARECKAMTAYLISKRVANVGK